MPRKFIYLKFQRIKINKFLRLRWRNFVLTVQEFAGIKVQGLCVIRLVHFFDKSMYERLCDLVDVDDNERICK
jgi:hypothetical protein